MSTELAKLSGGELSPAIMKKLKDQVANEQERIGPSGGADMISVSNRTRKFKFPNDHEIEEFEGYIVDFAYRNEYYIGAYNPKEVSPPACFAIAPSTTQLIASNSSPIKQNDDCATCQHNQFGSAINGNGKACKNTVILAIIVPNAENIDDCDLWVLKTSPTAIRPFNKYASTVSQMGIPIGAVRTKFFFDPDNDYASVRFDAVGVDADNIDKVMERKEAAQARLMEEPDVSQFVMPTADK